MKLGHLTIAVQIKASMAEVVTRRQSGRQLGRLSRSGSSMTCRSSGCIRHRAASTVRRIIVAVDFYSGYLHQIRPAEGSRQWSDKLGQPTEAAREQQQRQLITEATTARSFLLLFRPGRRQQFGPICCRPDSSRENQTGVEFRARTAVSRDLLLIPPPLRRNPQRTRAISGQVRAGQSMPGRVDSGHFAGP